MNFTETLQSLTGKPLSACTNQELYLALLELVRRKSADRVQPVTGRKLYYISAEFLIGKLLSNNLINLGLYDEARDALAAAGKNLADIEEVEPEPSLGNYSLPRVFLCLSAIFPPPIRHRPARTASGRPPQANAGRKGLARAFLP